MLVVSRVLLEIFPRIMSHSISESINLGNFVNRGDVIVICLEFLHILNKRYLTVTIPQDLNFLEIKSNN